MTKVIHKIVRKKNYSAAICLAIFINIIASFFIIPLAYAPYWIIKEIWTLIVSTVVATLAYVYINHGIYDDLIQEQEVVEHVIK